MRRPLILGCDRAAAHAAKLVIFDCDVVPTARLAEADEVWCHERIGTTNAEEACEPVVITPRHWHAYPCTIWERWRGVESPAVAKEKADR
jgi:hypothetical protein